ncbi:DoxX family protein [Achromobacter sp. NFACC18-2]|uniref:DoxX family protein n=1 Tax=Achromobacter sp. NFACC18-2 TaxID=1564112 RepID=UPI0008ACBDD3|nr:DoxX family protein [Achromobacter sp. NFACC18-2]SEJ10523.1 putative oxidoreductase [Achromobacter sp. NFACC18-2]
MNNTKTTKGWSGLRGAANGMIDTMTKVAGMVAPLFLRVALALPFFKSGLTKWDGWLVLSPSATYLFQEEFKLHILGQVYDLPAPGVLAFATGLAEIVFPILLILGLATRFSALGLLGMTAVIQLIVPDGWANFHLPWATLAIALIAIGPGPLSVDHWIRGRFG